MIVLYSTGCPRCNVLKQKLDSKSIRYEVNTSVDEMEALGISQVPVLLVDEKLMRFTDAVKWVNEIQTKEALDNSGYINYNDVMAKADKYKPKLIVAGASAYSRKIDFERFHQLAQNVGAYLMVDMAHIAGLVISGDHPSPFGIADIITTTTHKTLRGTRGGIIFCKPELAKKIDSAVFPGTQGGPLMHIIAGKAITAEEACTPEFSEYIHQVVKNCKAMCNEFISMGYKVITGGTDNHLFLLDLTDTGLTGKEVQDELDKHHITLNKNCVPNEKRSPQQASGVRIGTAAMTTKGYTEKDFIEVARKIDTVIKGMMEHD